MPSVLFKLETHEITKLNELELAVQALDLAALLFSHMRAVALATRERDDYVIALARKHNQEITALTVDGLKINKLTGEVEIIELTR